MNGMNHETFDHFSAALVKSFAVSINEAYYALGRRGKLRETTIMKYIRKRLNHPPFQNENA